jgi:NDP-sugar pyrophosphorylase family protein
MKQVPQPRRRHALHAIALRGTFAVACGDGPTEVDSLTDLAGRWEATRVEFTVIADPQQTAEIIQQGGSLVLVIEDDGSFRQETTFPGDPDLEIDAGIVELTGDSLVFNPVGETVSFAYTLSGEVLTLVANIELERRDFGFTSDDFEVPARLEMNLRRS